MRFKLEKTIDGGKALKAQANKPTNNQFNDIVKGVLAFKGGQRFSQACNTDLSDGFTHGSMNVADAMGFERDSLEWRLAMAGAMSHIETLQ